MKHMNEITSFPDRSIDQISDDAIEIGRVVAIYVYPVQREPSRSLQEVRAVAGQGLSGDHKRNPHRAVTLLSLQDWHEVTAELRSDLPPATRRANLLVHTSDSSTEFAKIVGMRLHIGEAKLLVRGETTPCKRMNEACTGLEHALSSGMRGGVFGPVVNSGLIRVDDVVTASVSTSESQLQQGMHLSKATNSFNSGADAL